MLLYDPSIYNINVAYMCIIYLLIEYLNLVGDTLYHFIISFDDSLIHVPNKTYFARMGFTNICKKVFFIT